MLIAMVMLIMRDGVKLTTSMESATGYLWGQARQQDKQARKKEEEKDNGIEIFIVQSLMQKKIETYMTRNSARMVMRMLQMGMIMRVAEPMTAERMSIARGRTASSMKCRSSATPSRMAVANGAIPVTP